MLGLENNDFDVCISGNSDIEGFARAIETVCETKGITKLEDNLQEDTVISIIRVNLKKDLWIDITYIENIEDDSKTRDFPLNSIYFNVNEMKIEDPANGIYSIKNKIIQIAVEPKKAFYDKPRRILRLLRFVSILGFSVSQEIIDALLEIDENNFKKKVPSARIGLELMKMLNEAYFQKVFPILLNSLSNLFGMIFDIDGIYKLNAIEAFHRVIKIKTPNNALYFAAIYLPLKDSKYKLSGVCKKYQIPNVFAVEGRRFFYASQIFDDQGQIELTRYSAGKILIELGQNWKLASEILQTESGQKLFSQFSEFVINEGMEDAWSTKPFFSNRELIGIHGKSVNPSSINKLGDSLLRWQLENPSKSKSDYIQYVKTLNSDTSSNDPN